MDFFEGLAFEMTDHVILVQRPVDIARAVEAVVLWRTIGLESERVERFKVASIVVVP